MVKKTYQQLRNELDEIMAALQAPELNVDEALTYYKRGQKVLAELEAYVQSAENTVRELDGREADD